LLVLVSAAFLVAGAAASPGSTIDPLEALKRAAVNEEKAKAAEGAFSYKQDILVQTFGQAGSVTAQLHRVSEFGYDDLGNRVERIISYPSSRLAVVLGVMQPNFKNLLGIDPFFLDTTGLERQAAKFVSREKLDELNTLVFELEPRDAKTIAKDNRPFKGKIWIDEQDLTMVKFAGVAVTTKDENARFPKFECYRENVEGSLWLPSVVLANDVLDMKRYDFPIKIDIQYTGYKRIKARS
jgi:hypothetical protein